MNILLPFILSSLIPGTGQFYLKRYLLGIAFFLLPFALVFLLPDIPLYYPYLIMIVISVTDVYLRMEKIASRKKALTNLSFSVLIAVVVIPSVFYLFYMSMYRGGEYVTTEYLNVEHTENEMIEISFALNKYKVRNKKYPQDFNEFVHSKPIWESWATDSWGNKYRYNLTQEGFVLTSSGVDGKFNTEDDIVRKN
ncbi:type II secretion system protein GspG [Marivirga lumbricoides]